MFVAGFIGSPTMNFLDRHAGAGRWRAVRCGMARQLLPLPRHRAGRRGPSSARKVVAGIRPESLSAGGGGGDAQRHGRRGRADRARYHGDPQCRRPDADRAPRLARPAEARRADDARPSTPPRSTCSTPRPATASERVSITRASDEGPAHQAPDRAPVQVDAAGPDRRLQRLQPRLPQGRRRSSSPTTS